MTNFRSFFSSWSAVTTVVRDYWRIYGGWKAWLSSPYMHASVVVTALSFGAWIKSGWWESVITVSPTIIGFSLAGLAVFFGMGDSGFRSKLAERDEDESSSPFIDVVVALVHFIVWQLFALIYALTSKSLDFVWVGAPKWYQETIPLMTPFAWCFGYFLFIYSIFLVLATAFALFRTSRWFEAYILDSSKVDEAD